MPKVTAWGLPSIYFYIPGFQLRDRRSYNIFGKQIEGNIIQWLQEDLSKADSYDLINRNMIHFRFDKYLYLFI